MAIIYKVLEVTMKKQFNAIDVLKFVMAMFVVMIHVKPNAHSEGLTMVFTPFLSIAVPVFFVVSSMLIFSKLNGDRGGCIAQILQAYRFALFKLVFHRLLVYMDKQILFFYRSGKWGR